MKLHLVDGTYELFRAHYSAFKIPGGRAVSAVHILLQTLISLLRKENVTHIACAFDHVIESFRNELLNTYKNSLGVPENLIAQFDVAERAVRSLGVTVWPMVEFEADDAIATAVHIWACHPEMEQIVICSPDKDFAQLVRGNHVVCLDRPTMQ